MMGNLLSFSKFLLFYQERKKKGNLKDGCCMPAIAGQPLTLNPLTEQTSPGT